jgi:hypothetical protein
MKINDYFKKITSLFLAGTVFFTSIILFNGCKLSADNSINTKIPTVLNNYQLPLDDELICNLQNLVTYISDNNHLKSGIAGIIETNFGKIDWTDNQFVQYDNGIQGIFVPIKRTGITEAFLISNPLNNFNSLIVKVKPNQKNTDEFFTGKIEFYELTGKVICSYSYENGKFLKSDPNKSDSEFLKSAPIGTENCDFNCVYSCFNGIMTSDWLYGVVCGTACFAWESGIGLFICIFCVGGPALTCLDQCCPNIIE